MKITRKIAINQPAQHVWKIISEDFDKAHLWMDPIPHSFEIGNKQSSVGAPMEGRICHLSNDPNGAKVQEDIIQFSEAEKSLTFSVTSINVPAIVPLKKNQVQMQVKATGANSCEVIWRAQPQLKVFAYPLYPLLRLVIPQAFSKLLKGLKDYAEKTPANALA